MGSGVSLSRQFLNSRHPDQIAEVQCNHNEPTAASVSGVDPAACWDTLFASTQLL
jgi:hypothetical protein